MAITVETEENNNIDQGYVIRDWLNKMTKSLDFVYNFEPKEELSVSDALSGNSKLKVCDPYGVLYEPPLKNKIKNIEGITRSTELEKVTGVVNIQLTNGEELSGTCKKGSREGKGALYGPRLEQLGIHHISGQYTEGILTGAGRVHMLNSTVRDGWFQHGYFHGPVRGMYLSGELDFVGWYRAGIPVGWTWLAVRGGGWLVGEVDDRGEFTGPDIAFLFPDLRTAILGEYHQGQLVCGRPAQVVGAQVHENGVLVPEFTIASEKIYKRWISTNKDISCPPHLADPYESKLVQVNVSNMDDAGEGLFAKVDIAANTMIAYYNGLRLSAGESLEGEETGYSIFLELNLRKDKNAKHLDIPTKYHHSKDYSASLAHKLNHSFSPNCTWDNAEHPVHGLVPSVRTLEAVPAGAELTIHYSMDMESAPEWYMDEWDRHGKRLAIEN